MPAIGKNNDSSVACLIEMGPCSETKAVLNILPESCECSSTSEYAPGPFGFQPGLHLSTQRRIL